MPSFKSAFISYQTSDKLIAGSLKKVLSDIGINSFLAHEDIQVSEEWRTRIIKELSNTEIFICLLSKRYLESDWCIQESGIAAFRPDLLVIPLSLDGTIPTGFLRHIQSVKFQPEDINLTDIAPAFLKGKTEKGISTLINLIGSSYNYRDAEKNFSIILPILDELNEDQGKRLLELSCSNDQIYHAGLCAKEYLPKLLKNFGHLISDSQLNFLVSTCNRYGAEIVSRRS